jgi:hypothetical protein
VIKVNWDETTDTSKKEMGMGTIVRDYKKNVLMRNNIKQNCAIEKSTMAGWSD